MSLSREEIIRMAMECSDVIKDSRGREAFEFDEYGLERLANAAYAAGAAAEREPVRYVPMTDAERNEMMARWYENHELPSISQYIEAEVIRRAGLEVQE